MKRRPHLAHEVKELLRSARRLLALQRALVREIQKESARPRKPGQRCGRLTCPIIDRMCSMANYQTVVRQDCDFVEFEDAP